LDGAAKRKVFMETYGCQMNSSDSEIVMSIMQQAGYEETSALDDVRSRNSSLDDASRCT
jgi:tRNA-2-methylthio-N6-dimethylallyladenosine synthase